MPLVVPGYIGLRHSTPPFLFDITPADPGGAGPGIVPDDLKWYKKREIKSYLSLFTPEKKDPFEYKKTP